MNCRDIFYLHLELLGKRRKLGMTGYALYLDKETGLTFADILSRTGYNVNCKNLRN